MPRGHDIAERIARTMRSETRSFTALARIAGLVPGRSFRFADLRDIDFGGEDLDGFDFTGCDLRGADFTGSLIAGTIFDGATVTAKALAKARDAHLSAFCMGLRRREMSDADALQDLRSRKADLRSSEVASEMAARSLFFAIQALQAFWHVERWRWDLLVAASRAVDLSQIRPSELTALFDRHVPDSMAIETILVDLRDPLVVVLALRCSARDAALLPPQLQPPILREAAPWPAHLSAESARLHHALAMRHLRKGGTLMSSVWADLLQRVESAADVAELLSTIPFAPPTRWLVKARLRAGQAAREQDEGKVGYRRLSMQLDALVERAERGTPDADGWNDLVWTAMGHATRNAGRR